MLGANFACLTVTCPCAGRPSIRGPKNIPKRVGASTQPCCVIYPLLTVKLLDELPSNCMFAFMSSWKATTSLRSFGGQPIWPNTLYSAGLLTVSNALVRSTNATIRGLLCSLHFSWICRRMNIISVVDISDLKPHCVSGSTCSASLCKRLRITRANAFPATLRSEMPL